MGRHDEPHDRVRCRRCIELRRQEFVVPGTFDHGAAIEELIRRKQSRLVDPNDPELLWGDPPR